MNKKSSFHPLSLVIILFLASLASCTTWNTQPTIAPPVIQTDVVPMIISTTAEATAVNIDPTAIAVPTLPAMANGNFPLTILHTNDVHAHHAPSADGDGGEALAASVINQVRAARPNTLLLSAGDTFIGTLFYVLHHGTDSAELMNAMKYDAMTLGNHEFDEGDGNLALFIEKLTFPVLAANADFDSSSSLREKTVPFVILQKGAEKIGVIGLVNPETPQMSRPGSDLVFIDNLAEVIQTNVDELTRSGVNKIIILSHIGNEADQELAQSVTGIDIVVGGHTHTLLANYDTRAAGPYPTEVKNPEGKSVLVVQAGEYLQFLGRLDVEFDSNGEIVSWKGDSIYLSHYTSPDPAITTLVNELFAPVEALTREVIGESAVFLEGDRKVCRVQECNLGNLITDAMRSETGAQVGLENGGGIRASIKQGQVTRGDVLTVLPFGNLVSTLSLSGEDLLAVLENGASKMEEGGGRFLQVSGLRYQVDPLKPAGSRIMKVEVQDEQGNYQALNPQTIYTVATNDFISEGGDGFNVILNNGINVYNYGRPLDEVLTDYIQAHQPIDNNIEGRIIIK